MQGPRCQFPQSIEPITATLHIGFLEVLRTISHTPCFLCSIKYDNYTLRHIYPKVVRLHRDAVFRSSTYAQTPQHLGIDTLHPNRLTRISRASLLCTLNSYACLVRNYHPLYTVRSEFIFSLLTTDDFCYILVFHVVRTG